MFSGDRPIQNHHQDRLGRALFARYLARAMLEHPDTDSFVIGLYGSWGSGKTSVINLILEELNVASSNMLDEEKPIVLNFSPWSYSGQNELIYSFFRRLSSALRQVNYLENADNIIHLLELYASFFTHKPIPKALRSKHSLLDKLLRRKEKAVHGWESGRDLRLVKAELNDLLRHQKHKIIIIIDNISRLYPNEIKQIFQIVKSMGDYVNTAYLLSFDKEAVTHAINSIEGTDGEEFIDKVVQLPFDIPAISSKDIENILAEHLNELMPLVPIEAWSIEYWAELYYGGLRSLFSSVREITRYVNMLNFSYPRLRDIVNPVDFFALTAIQVCVPHVYEGIRDNKDLFTGLLDHVYAIDKEQIKKDKARCDEILGRNKKLQKEILLELLLHLFPRLRHLYQPGIAFHYSDAEARKATRVCSPDLFDAYFRLSMQSGQIMRSEFESILATAAHETSFSEALTRLNQDGRISQFLDLLDGQALRDIPLDHIAAVIDALLDNGDLFPIGTPGLLALDMPMRIHRIIHVLLQRIPNTQERFKILHHAIRQAINSLYIIIHEIIEQDREHNKTESAFLPIEFRDLTEEQLKLLKQEAIKQIAAWAETGRLTGHPQLIPILSA